MNRMPKFAVPGSKATGKETVLLYENWWNPLVIADVGLRFDRFHQLTGSCVGAGGGNALFTLIATQRLFAENPTKAFLPWWLFNYGRSRFLMGDRSKGEGSMGSTFAQSLKDDGVITCKEPGLPGFVDEGDEGLRVQSENVEMDWSDGDSRLVLDYSDEGRQHPLGTAAETKDPDGIADGIINGYPFTFACNGNCSNPRVVDGVLLGEIDSNGGHQVSLSAVRPHPKHGRLFGQQNNWPKGSYSRNPEPNQPTNFCWWTEKALKRALQLEAEVYALSHLPWFPAQPDVAIAWRV